MRYVAFLLFLSGCGAAPCGGPHVGQWAAPDFNLSLSDQCAAVLEDDTCRVTGLYLIEAGRMSLEVTNLTGTCHNWQLGQSNSLSLTVTDSTLTWGEFSFTRR